MLHGRYTFITYQQITSPTIDCPKRTFSRCGCNHSLIEMNCETSSPQNYNPEAVMEVVKPMFKELTDSGVLTNCVHGRTQNTNESLNQLIRCGCPNNTFGNADTLKAAANDDADCCNDENSARKLFWRPLELFHVCFVTLPSVG